MAQSKQQVENEKRTSTRRKTAGSKGKADWANAPAELLWQAIVNISKSGGAIRFGYTRDGGAYAVGVYDNGEHNTEYLEPSTDLREYLEGLAKDFSE